MKDRPRKKKQRVQPSSSEGPDLENENPNTRQDMRCFLSRDSKSTHMNQNVSPNSMEENSFMDSLFDTSSSLDRMSPKLDKILKSRSSFRNSSATSSQSVCKQNSTKSNVSSLSLSPVLGMRKGSRQQQFQSDSSFSLQQVVSNESNGWKESVSSCQKTLYENENNSNMSVEYESDSLPDLDKVQLGEFPSEINTNQESITCKTVKKEKRLKKLFGESDPAEIVASTNDKDQNMIDFYEDEEYVPQPLIQRRSSDLFENSSVGERDNENSTFDMQVENRTIKSNSNNKMKNKKRKCRYTSKPERKVQGKINTSRKVHEHTKRLYEEKHSDQSLIDSEAQENLLYDGKTGEKKDVEANEKSLTSNFRGKKRKTSKGKSKACDNVPANQPKVTHWATFKANSQAYNLRRQCNKNIGSNKTEETFEEQDNVFESLAVPRDDVNSYNSKEITLEKLIGMDNKSVKCSDIVKENEFEDKCDDEDPCFFLDYTGSNECSSLSSSQPQFLEDEGYCSFCLYISVNFVCL